MFTGYIYLTTCLINGKVYIGKKELIEWLQSLDYLGSGLLIKRAINKYGTENFKKELICYCSSREELNKMEKFFISYYESNNPEIGYNISKGGDGGRTWQNLKYTDSEKYNEICKKISEYRKEYLKNIENNTWHYPPSQDTINKRIQKLTGQKRTEETKEKMSIIAKNRPQFTEEHCKNISIARTGQVAYNKGVPASEESKEKNRQAHLGKIVTEETKILHSLNSKLMWAKRKNKIDEIKKLEKEIQLYKEFIKLKGN